jgi:hypothetical protein
MLMMRTFCIFPEDVQQFEKAVLGRSSRRRSDTTAELPEDDSEMEKGTDSEKGKDEDEDEEEAPKKRPVSTAMSSFVV